jgi:hypothetical protein
MYIVEGEKVRGRDNAISLFVKNEQLAASTLEAIKNAYMSNDVVLRAEDSIFDINPLIDSIE